MLRRALIVPVVFAALAAVVSCGEEHHSYVANVTDTGKTPTMVTTDVSTFISDSGFTRYHITADIWNIYDDTVAPSWTFPTGLVLEQYDDAMQPIGRVSCDSATYLTQKRLWQLDGRVVMVNADRDSFLTPQLFWDQARQEVYSDSFIHIVRTNHIIEGYGFRSNQAMTDYTVNRPTAIIPINRDKPGTPASATNDSTPAPPRRTPGR